MSIFYQNRKEPFYAFFSKNNTFPFHIHRQVELLFVISGKIKVQIGETHQFLQKGDFSIVFPNQIHSYRTDERSDIFLLLFDSDFIEDCYSLFSEMLPESPFLLQKKDQEDLGEHGERALHALMAYAKDTEKETLNTLMKKGYLSILLSALFAKMPVFLDNTHSADGTSERLLQYLESHFTEPLSAQQVAKEIGISRHYLSHLFSDRFHLSFHQYLTGKRLAFAARLLNTTDYAVTDISFEAGFGSVRSFFRAFQEEYGITPKEYRKSHKFSR